MALTTTQGIRNKIDVFKKQLARIEDCVNTFNYVLTQNDVQTWELTNKGEKAVEDMRHQIDMLRDIAIPAITKTISSTEAYCDRIDNING